MCIVLLAFDRFKSFSSLTNRSVVGLNVGTLFDFIVEKNTAGVIMDRAEVVGDAPIIVRTFPRTTS